MRSKKEKLLLFTSKADSGKIVESDVESDEDLDGLYESALIDKQKVKNCEVVEKDDITRVISYKENGTKCVSEYSDNKINKFYYNKNNEEIYTETVNLDDINKNYNNSQSVSRGTGIKVYEIFNFKHWYKLGKKEYYLHIGCDWAYEIKYGALNDGDRANCNEYMSAINASNKKMTIAIAAVAAAIVVSVKSGLATSIAAAILDLSSQGLTAKEIYKYIAKKYGARIAGLLGVSSIGSIISNAFGFSEDRARVKEYYKIIRKYGERIGGNGSGSW